MEIIFYKMKGFLVHNFTKIVSIAYYFKYLYIKFQNSSFIVALSTTVSHSFWPVILLKLLSIAVVF